MGAFRGPPDGIGAGGDLARARCASGGRPHIVSLWIASVALSAIYYLLLLLAGHDWMPQSDQAFQDTARISVYFAGIASTIYDAVIVVAHLLIAFWAIRMRAGRIWARILLAAFGGTAVVCSLVGLEPSFGTAAFGRSFAALGSGGLVSVVAGVSLIAYPLTVAAMIVMYLPGARSWFTRSAATG